MSKINIRQITLTDELRSGLHQSLSRHSKEKTGHNGEGEIDSLMAYKGEVFVGAVTFEIFWGALHIKHLLVEEEFRGHGIALQLMEQALEFGKQKGCPFAYLETMNFQAIDFYIKLGFILEFTRSGFNHNASLHYLRKNL